MIRTHPDKWSNSIAEIGEVASKRFYEDLFLQTPKQYYEEEEEDEEEEEKEEKEKREESYSSIIDEEERKEESEEVVIPDPEMNEADEDEMDVDPKDVVDPKEEVEKKGAEEEKSMEKETNEVKEKEEDGGGKVEEKVKPFACPECDFRSAYPKILEKHIDRKHRGDFSFLL